MLRMKVNDYHDYFNGRNYVKWDLSENVGYSIFLHFGYCHSFCQWWLPFIRRHFTKVISIFSSWHHCIVTVVKDKRFPNNAQVNYYRIRTIVERP